MTTPNKRYRYGNSFPVKAPFVVGVQINEGDFLYIDSLTPTSVLTPDGNTGYAARPASTLTYASAIADPTIAPTISANAAPLGPGFTVAGAGFKVAYTWVTVDGVESGPSPLSTAMNTNGDGINAQIGAAMPTGTYAVNWYVTTDGGDATTLRRVAQTVGGIGLAISGPPASDAPKPPAASSLSALVLTQVSFAKLFFGVSKQTNLAAAALANEAYGMKDGYVAANGDGVFDFTCASASFNNGDLLGVGTLTGSALDSQTVVAVTQLQAAIARVVQDVTTSTTVRARILNTKERINNPY